MADEDDSHAPILESTLEFEYYNLLI
jgi:hypothetical protein